MQDKVMFALDICSPPLLYGFPAESYSAEMTASTKQARLGTHAPKENWTIRLICRRETSSHYANQRYSSKSVRACTTYSSYINLLLDISKHATDFPKPHQELLKHLLCSVDKEDCMSNSFDVCKESNIWDIPPDSNPSVRMEGMDLSETETKTRLN
ncbi:hypothetical protein TNCT_239141 [Trichonephila clavata]|uniref:Uncharacterized protein n=1 Tax=Trichonephila clavata TaxID=2740835 RepID=A0A8X6LSC7_TRICU|nr:hypothetical protein TNCT_239141 [Trichonephila clavata]